MSGTITNSGVTPTVTSYVSNDALLAEVSDVRQSGAQAVQGGITELTNISGDAIANFSAIMGLPSLAAPTTNSSSADIALRIGLLQDALNQLMAEVSKLGLTQKMNEANAKNLEQLEKMNESIRQNAEAAAKADEAAKKGNIIDAISNWVMAAVSIVSAVINIISAVAQAAAAVVTLGAYGYGMVAAAALIGSAVALGVAAGGQIALAIDSTIQACGGAGILTQEQRDLCAKVIEIASVVAMSLGMVGLVGGIAASLTSAAGQVGGALGKESAKVGVAEIAKAAAKEAAESAMQGIKAAVAKFIDAPLATLKAAMQALIDSLKSALSNMLSNLKSAVGGFVDDAASAARYVTSSGRLASQAAARQSIDDAVTQGLQTGLEKSVGKSLEEANEIIIREVFLAVQSAVMKSTSTAISRAAFTSAMGGVVNELATHAAKLEKLELDGEARDLAFDASVAEADAKALTAQIAKLMALIEQMQKEMEESLDSGQETLAIIHAWASGSETTLETIAQHTAN